MLILAIETATEICSIALAENDHLIGEYSINIHRAHAEKLIPLIQSMSEQVNRPLTDIDLICVSSGPGSFTGLRIGLASAKGLAFSLNCPLVSVISLDALAYQTPIQAGTICTLVKARTNEVYAALYQKDLSKDIPVLVKQHQVLEVDRLADYIPNKTWLIGNGLFHFRKNFDSFPNKSLFFTDKYHSQPQAYSTAYLGWRKYQQTTVNEAINLEPFYIQEFRVKTKKINQGVP